MITLSADERTLLDAALRGVLSHRFVKVALDVGTARAKAKIADIEERGLIERRTLSLDGQPSTRFELTRSARRLLGLSRDAKSIADAMYVRG